MIWLILHITVLILRLLSNFSCFLSSADFFQNHLFPNILSGIPSECQTVCTEIRNNTLLALIWVQTVCKDYQQMTISRQCVKGSKYRTSINKDAIQLLKIGLISSNSVDLNEMPHSVAFHLGLTAVCQSTHLRVSSKRRGIYDDLYARSKFHTQSNKSIYRHRSDCSFEIRSSQVSAFSNPG